VQPEVILRISQISEVSVFALRMILTKDTGVREMSSLRRRN